MSKFCINGGKELRGEINISGAKNSALKILTAAILSKEESIISNVPDIIDIRSMIQIIESIGAKVSFYNNVLTIDPSTVESHSPNETFTNKLRGSIVLVGPLLARFGKAKISKPGGCLIGARPIDDHIDVFAQLNVKTIEKAGKYVFTGKPKANKVVLSKLSVTATENAIMASVLSPGTTSIFVAAAEPEIVDLANFLNKMGAKIKGAGTHEITVTGVKKLSGVKYDIMPDRLEAATYLMFAIATNSALTIGPVVQNHMSIILKKLLEAGGKFEIIKKGNAEYIKTFKRGSLTPVSIDTRTYPGFSTDMQSPYVTLMTQASGESQVFETLFEGRFLYVDELKLMGAKIEFLSPHLIKINGPTALKPGVIVSRDLRGGAALVMAGLIAKGTTTIESTEYIDRGYEAMDKKLMRAGAEIERIEG